MATGWGFFNFQDGQYTGPQSGVLRGSHNDSIDDRLLVMFEGMEAVIDAMRPDIVCVEAAFVGRNMKTAIALARVWGAITIAAKRAKVMTQFYTPTEIRQVVTSYGRSSKDQVADTVSAVASVMGVLTMGATRLMVASAVTIGPMVPSGRDLAWQIHTSLTWNPPEGAGTWKVFSDALA